MPNILDIINEELRERLEAAATPEEITAVLFEWVSGHGGGEFAMRSGGVDTQGFIAPNPKAETKH